MTQKNLLITKKRVSYNPFTMILPYLFGILAVSLIFITGILDNPIVGGALQTANLTTIFGIILFVIGFIVGWIINSIFRAIRN